MSIVASGEPRIQDVRVTAHEIIAHLVDGRVISVPLAWSWRLAEATPAQRAHFRLIGSGQGVHWPDVDEDISVEGMLHGSPAPRPKRQKKSRVRVLPDNGPAQKPVRSKGATARASGGARRARR